NSPYSIISDLPSFDDDNALNLFDNPSGITITEEYDPTEYDIPDSGTLLTLDQGFMSGEAFPHVSITPAPAFDRKVPATNESGPFEHSSPASSNGAEDDARSHASSTSSFRHNNGSPHLDFEQNFEGLRFESPAWGAQNLPSSPPAQKAPSPPQLVIPASPAPSSTGLDVTSPPTINAPAGDGMPAHPQLHIVPATPVSGGADGQQPSLFRNVPSGECVTMSCQHTCSCFVDGQHGLTSSDPANWDAHAQLSQSIQDQVGTSGMSYGGDEASGDSSQAQQYLTQSLRHPSSAGPVHSTFGGQPLQPNLSNQFNFGSFGNDYLSPDIAASNLRRTKSDGRGHRVVRSEDYGYGHQSTSFLNPNDMLVPPPSITQQEFLRNAATRQFLHPAEPVASIRGHHRRASSGSRERPGMGGISGWSSGASSARASPYPSPSASPRPGYGLLPDMGGMPMSVSMTAMHRTPSGTMMTTDMSMDGGMGSMSMDTSSVPAHIAKVNVTTPSTADASQKRRKQPANFVCPVPGCGSTFTRHFNLKGESRRASFLPCVVKLTRICDIGHLRSHAEEKPFQCKWPGCGKGFARQHDCKRHEQLHLNIRPILARAARRTLPGWTRLTATVSILMIAVSFHGS
ncbi:uncharacterized protein B0H18DRAFT_1001139, partial [Fomitopsis serialis]|uniref:uncharacterized protein n=1 Tax=Fomitopsis serialis TaxID=139415 RepID=UPI0020089626